jgi:GNAT superfamily N-acetyltransferase
MHDALIRANLENRYQFLLSHGATPLGQCADGPDLKWAYSGRAALNLVCAARLAEAETDTRIAQTVTHYRGWQTSFFWLTDPLTRPADLPRRLLARGFYYDDELRGMTLDLQAWPGHNTEAADLTVVEVTGPAAHTWACIACRGFAIPEPYLSNYAAVLTDIAAAPLPYRRYLGCRGEHPVATLCVFTTGDVAGIYWVSTLPEARGRGYATALMVRALGDAQAAGARLAILQSSHQGHDLYRHLGFEDCCTEVSYGYSVAGA